MIAFVLYALLAIALAAHLVAAALGVAHLRQGVSARSASRTRAAVVIGCGAFAVLLALRYAFWGVVPLTNAAESLCLFVAIVSAIALVVTRSPDQGALLGFYAVPLMGLAVVCSALAVPEIAQPPRNAGISQLFLVVHVVLAFLAYALFFVGSVTSMVYAYQARRLKSHRTMGLFQKLPSLERLDASLYRLIGAAYPLFVITLVLGLVWAWYSPEQLSATWWWSPKILLSAVMVIFYALCYHARARGYLRGPKLAHFVFVGFTTLLAVYLALESFRLTDYNFWDASIS